ncbi:MAG: S8 family serine peptidase [Betaproteobacteria bacterium]
MDVQQQKVVGARFWRLDSRCVKLCASFALAAVQAFLSSTSLAQAPMAIGPAARAQISELIAEKAARTPAQQKIDSSLLRAIDAQRPAPQRPTLKALAQPKADAGGRLLVDIELVDDKALGTVIAMLRQSRAVVLFSSVRFRSIRAEVAAAALESIAAQPGVRFVDVAHQGAPNKNSTSEGLMTHRANLGQTSLGYTGIGQKVCALSDGVNSIAARQATGDLPPSVYVLPGEAGSGDEGTAMLEILNDLAPGAQLGFATAYGGEAAFAQNILDLADPAMGACTIIVDDYEYFAEPPFQDGIIAGAVNTVTAAGVLYFAAAANSGSLDAGTSGTWEGTFSTPGNLTNALIPGHTLHEFVPGVPANPATTAAPRVMLHWAEPQGAANIDYDLYVLDPTMSIVLGASTNVQNGTQNPFEYINAPNGNPFPAGSRVVIAKKTGAPDRMLNVQWYRGRLTYATNGAIRGHPAAANAFSVAATAAAGAYGAPPSSGGPYPGAFSRTSEVELFSSDGPRRMYFDPAGNLLPGAAAGNFTATGGVVRNKPDITAADGVSTDSPGFETFFGTSAAVAHAAAAAALIKQAFPSWTQQQFRSAVFGAATDIDASGWDRNTGAGIIMPLAVLQANGAPPVAAIKLAGVTTTEVNGNGNGVANAGEDWKFELTLGNDGGVAASGVVATLVSNTPGVVVTSPPVAYAGIPVGGITANPTATPFRFSIFNIDCGQALSFSLRVTTAQNGAALVFPIFMGTELALGTPQFFNYGGAPVAIPDAGVNAPGATVAAAVNVSGITGGIGKVRLHFNGLNNCSPNSAANAGIDHPYVGDLVLGLKAPDGTTVNLVNRMLGGTNDGQNLCGTVLDDLAPGSAIGVLSPDLAPFTGTFKPDSPLAVFRGRNANGAWSLQATDQVVTAAGNINNFTIEVAPQACSTVQRGVTMTATKTVTGSFVPGGAVTYTMRLTNTGNAVQADNTGDEYVDILSSLLTVTPDTSTATSGALIVNGNTVRWNGALDAGASVTITVHATINAGTTGMSVSNQGTVSYDAQHRGINDTTVLTDDPTVAGSANPTVFVVGAANEPPVGATLDADGNGTYDALTDGVLVLRYLFGLAGSTLVNGAIGAGAQRTQPEQIIAYLDGMGMRLDADGDGRLAALSDGLLILRYMFGLRGAGLIAGAVGSSASRTTAAQIETYLQSVMP